jgi:hypothetical protein
VSSTIDTLLSRGSILILLFFSNEHILLPVDSIATLPRIHDKLEQARLVFDVGQHWTVDDNDLVRIGCLNVESTRKLTDSGISRFVQELAKVQHSQQNAPPSINDQVPTDISEGEEKKDK